MTFEESFQLENIAKPTENSSGTNPDLNVKWAHGCNIKTIKESQCQKTILKESL